MLDQPTSRPLGFDLGQYWAQSSAAFVANLPRYMATVKIHSTWVDRTRASWRYAKIERLDPPDADGWCVAVVNFEVLDEAVGNILQCSRFIQVIEPHELKTAVREWALAVAHMYS